MCFVGVRSGPPHDRNVVVFMVIARASTISISGPAWSGPSAAHLRMVALRLRHAPLLLGVCYCLLMMAARALPPPSALKTSSRSFSKLSSLSVQQSSAGAAKIMSGRRLTTLLGLSYLSVIASVMTLPCCLSLVDQSLFTGGKLGAVIFSATCGTVGGKFLLGVPTDRLGGQAVLKLCLALNTLLLTGISQTSSRVVFALLWILVSFIYGSAWGAVGNVVRKSYEKQEWGEQLGLVAAYSRVGSFRRPFCLVGSCSAPPGRWARSRGDSCLRRPRGCRQSC